MGIADDISPRREKLTAKSELDSLDGSLVVPVRQTTTRVAEEKAIFEPKNPDTADFFPPNRTKNGKKEEIVIEAKSDKEEDSLLSRLFTRKSITWIVIIILAVLAWQYRGQIAKIFGGSSGTKTSDSGAVTIVPQDYTSDAKKTEITTTPPTSTETTAPAAATTPATTPTTPATTTAPATTTTAPTDKSKLTIDLLNGNGITSTAATYKAILTKAGYTVSAVGNAANFHYWSTYVYYKTGLDAAAADIKTVLKRKSVLLKNDDTITKNYDIVIIIGSH